MSARMQALEKRELVRTDSWASPPANDGASIVTIAETGFLSQAPATTYGPVFKNHFTEELQDSWVYRRNQAFRLSGISASTSTLNSTGLSFLSGLSVACVSNISVINLVVTEGEVFNSWRSSQNWLRDRSDPLRPLLAHKWVPQIEKPTERREYDEFPRCERCGETVTEGKAYDIGEADSSIFMLRLRADIAIGNYVLHLGCLGSNTCDATVYDFETDIFLLGGLTLMCSCCRYECIVCKEKIEDGTIILVDQAFCSTCFKCNDCGKQIEDLKYFRRTGGIICRDCNTCCKCNEPLETGRARRTSRGWYCSDCSEETRQKRLKQPHHPRPPEMRYAVEKASAERPPTIPRHHVATKVKYSTLPKTYLYEPDSSTSATSTSATSPCQE